MIAREGYAIAGVALALSAALGGVGLFLPSPWSALFFAAAAGLGGGALLFFRDPVRTPPPDADRMVLAPADGKVVLVEHEAPGPPYVGSEAQKVSIFLSLFDVHVNRIPASGVVEHVAYIPGDWLAAWRPEASERNERSEIGLRHPSGRRVLFRQIAGAVARRIAYHVKKGDRVAAGQRFGIIKFGSRMDVFVPRDVVLDVSVGDRVRAGETVLGHFPVAGRKP